MLPISTAGYLFLFFSFGALLLGIALTIGKLLRPNDPHAEKLSVYECGEPTIGSSFVQFDLRFYVVALLFIIFDVEVAFFFPWATVFGKSTHLMDPNFEKVAMVEGTQPGELPRPELTRQAQLVLKDLGDSQPSVPFPTGSVEQNQTEIEAVSKKLALFTLLDIGVFLAVLVVGFAYVWRRGDLDWVRAVSEERAEADRAAKAIAMPERVLVGSST